MTVDSPAPVAAPRPLSWWLLPLGVAATAAIGILWAIPRPASACIAISPAPPECAAGGDPAAILPFLVLIVALSAAYITCALLIPARRRPLVLGLLAGALGLVFLIGLAVAVAASQPPVVYY